MHCKKVMPFGAAQLIRSSTPSGGMDGSQLKKPIVSITSTVNGEGYWLVATDGTQFISTYYYIIHEFKRS